MAERVLKIKLYRPKLGVGTKTLIALSVSFWLPVMALLGVLFILLHDHFHDEATAQIRLGLKGAKSISQERVVVLEQLLPQLATHPGVIRAFNEQNTDRLQSLLLEFGKRLDYVPILTAVDDDQRLIARQGNSLGEVVKLGDILTRAVVGGEQVSATKLVSRDFLMQENEELASLVRDIGIVQFVVTPVIHNDRILGALVAGVLLTADTNLGDRVFERLGLDFALFAGKPTEGATLHAASSQPRTLWSIGEHMPEKLQENIQLDKPYYGALDMGGVEAIVAFEPLKDDRNRTIGAIGVSSVARGMASLVTMTLGKGLLVAAILGLFIALVVTYFVRNDIKRPMDTLIDGMERFGEGELDISVNIETGDQFERLGEGFNTMARGVFKREQRLMKHNAVAKLLMSTLDLSELLDQTLKVVVEVSESQVGVVYLWDQAEEALVCQARYGTQHDLTPLKMGEGYAGRAAQDQEILIEPYVSAMTDATIESGFAKGEPKVVAYIPLIYKERLLGVLVLGTVNQYKDDELQLIGYLADQISIVLDNAIMHHRIQELSITDGLTGLYNRRYINDRLEELWARAVRHGEHLTVILADIDNFKAINDTYGHDRGDEVICRISEIYRKGSRQEDLVARYGGEEFLVVLANTETQDAMVLAERIGKMAREQEYEWANRKVTLSIGVATYPAVKAASYVELVRMADQAMYKAKLSGKDQVVIYDESVESVLQG